MKENPKTTSMEKTAKIIRRSIHKFFQHYQFFTTIPTFIALPYSITFLLSQSILPRSFSPLQSLSTRIYSIFDPPYSNFTAILSLKLSQKITSFIITLPFSISFLLIAKSAIIHSLRHENSKEKSSSPLYFISLYNSLFSTQICNSSIIFSTNATCFSLFFLGFTFLEELQINSPRWVLFLSSLGAIFYSFILANTLVICNLALVSSGMENTPKGGFMEIPKACLLIRGKTMTALGLAVFINLGLVAVEALFRFRIVNSADLSSDTEGKLWLLALEGVFIGYMYSILLVLEVIMSCMFYQSCKKTENDHEECYYYDYVVENLELEMVGGFSVILAW